MSKRTLKMIAFCLLMHGYVFHVANDAWAQEAGLYDDPPPEGTSYVRFLNRSKLQEPIVTLSGSTFSIGTKLLTDYSYLKEGSYDANFNTASLPISLAAGKFYTIVIGDAEAEVKPIVLLEDQVISDTSHAGLYFYNFTDQPLNLIANVNGKSGVVFQNTGSAATEFREVKPFEVTFEVQAGGKSVATLPQISFRRGSGLSIVATKAGAGVAVDAVNNSVEK
jgi:Alginate O-acetyl transferase AlgF